MKSGLVLFIATNATVTVTQQSNTQTW